MNQALNPAAAWPFPTKSVAQDDEQAASAVAADTNVFVTVPETTLPNGQVVPAFQVGKYLCAIDADGKVTVNEEAVPTVYISFNKARDVLATAGLPMLTLSQSAALAFNVAGVAANWSGGEVGKGDLMRGLHLGTVSGAVAGTYKSKNESEHRGFLLSSGEEVFDVAGHLYTWLFDDVQGNEKGVVKRSFAEDSPAVMAPFPSGEQGMGYYPDAGDNWSGDALIRGGYWYSSGNAGVFLLNHGSPDYGRNGVGVRCTKPSGL